MTALSVRVMGRSHSPRRAGLGAYFMGWLVFFDGLASSIMVGKTLRPIADRAGLSREKLAFIVDSTSAPVAGLALLSTWVAYEMSVIRQGLDNTGDAALANAVAPFSWLVLSLPFRFYNWFMLLLVFLPTLILVFAWMLNSTIKELGTANYLVALLGDRLPSAWLPALVFLLASIISFSTGTSWGTMAIVMPLAIPLAVKLTAFHAGMAVSPVLVATVGAVLAGAAFGDHCSPISDTTIVSAFSSDCDVMAHVRTQLPYALTAALLAAVLGYLPAGYGVSPWWLLPAGALACWLLVRYRGQRVEESGTQ